jgi:hypothetical protein
MAKLLLGYFVVILLIASVPAFSGRTTRPMLADTVIVLQPVSYAPMDEMSSPSSASATRTSRIRMACYPAYVQCTKNSDCCSGFCRTGLSQTYCDY